MAQRLGLVDEAGTAVPHPQPKAIFLDEFRGPQQRLGDVPDLLGKAIANDELISRVVDPSVRDEDLKKSPTRMGAPRESVVMLEALERFNTEYLPCIRQILALMVKLRHGNTTRARLASAIADSLRTSAKAGRLPKPRFAFVLHGAANAKLKAGLSEGKPSQTRARILSDGMLVRLALDEYAAAETEAAKRSEKHLRGKKTGDWPKRSAEVVTARVGRRLLSAGPRGLGVSSEPVRKTRWRTSRRNLPT